MVYRRSMNSVLALLLLAVSPAEAAIAPTTVPATMPAADIVEAHARHAVPKQNLRILPQDQRMEAYDQFRGLYETARFAEALPYARRVVELSDVDAERDYELPIAYNNLGATQYQLGEYKGAAESYRKSLELLESTQGISSRRLIVPLAGLGAVLAAQNEHLLAVEMFDRALAVNRRAEGLFNLAQLPLIEQNADSRFVINDFAGVEVQRNYALKIAEQNYGYGDERTLPPLLELAAFYETLRQFSAARMMYLRARDVAFKESGGFNPLVVKALNGITRTHRLQYTMDPDTVESQQPERDEFTGEIVGKAYRESRGPPQAADRTGLKPAQTALELLRATPDPPKDLLTETLIEIGDWYQSTSRPTQSLPYYEEAARIFEAQQAGDPLAGNALMVPRMVFYRPPVSASRGLNAVSGQYLIRKTVFNFAVSQVGLPLGVRVVSTDMTESQLGQSVRALSRAIYSPRFANGRAVATEDVTFTGEWYEERNSSQAPEPPVTIPGADAPAPAETPVPEPVKPPDQTTTEAVSTTASP